MASTITRKTFAALVSGLLISGCVTQAGAVSPVAGAAIMSTVALGAAGVSRAGGGCYASCPTGTVCNARTGLCDTLPCRGRCSSTERCETTGLLEKCVPGAQVDLQIETPGQPAVAPERKTPQ